MLDRSMSVSELLAQRDSSRLNTLDRSLSVNELMAHADPTSLKAMAEPLDLGSISVGTVDDL